MANLNTPPRMKRCAAPAVGNFDPSADYEKNDLVKIGRYSFLAIDSTKIIWFFTNFEVAPAFFSTTRIISNGSDALSVTLALLPAVTLDLRLATVTRSKDTGELIAAALTTLALDANIRVCVNPAWYETPPILSSGSSTNTFTTVDGVYRAKTQIRSRAANSSVFPVESALYAPQDVDRWEQVTGWTIESEGARSYCQTDNPIERGTCARCGNPT